MKFEIVHVDTCLPDYWSGHHAAHICVPVWHGMTFNELKSSLHSEVSMGAVAGSDTIAELLNMCGGFSDADTSAAYQAAQDAVDAITLSESADPECLFSYLDRADEEEDSPYCESVYAYFLIVDAEG